MQGAEVYGVLKGIGVTKLHHANSVLTSCTFLEHKGLLSRGYVEDRGLKQTPQNSDATDKKYDIWHRVFLDHVDIHERAGRVKGPNQYGPVLFVVDVEVLLHLPEGSTVMVTKRNPIYWQDNDQEGDRWFLGVEELRENLRFGNFDKMLVIQTPSNKLDSPDHRVQVYLDDPERQLSNGDEAYAHAKLQLETAATEGHITAPINPHSCRNDCICVEKYKAYDAEKIDFYFK